MIYREIYGDLFAIPNDYYLVQCISADFGMGKGIAVQFNKHFDMKNKLVLQYGNYLSAWDSNFEETVPCIKEGRVFNLITKRNYWGKPTYYTLENSLIALKCMCNINNVTKLAMPTIASGLDKLDWDKVSEMINYLFEDTNIEILVCKQYEKQNNYIPKKKMIIKEEKETDCDIDIGI